MIFLKMKFKATIEILDCDSDKFLAAFAAELKNPKNDRSQYTLTKQKKGVIFKIEAQDPTALRATNDSIIKMVIVFEKMKTIK